MIRTDLHARALRAIHRLTVQGRLMAQDQAPHARIASLLDDTEYLLALMQSPEDDTQLFVDYLEDTTARCGCSGVFDEFTQPAVTRVG